MKNKFEQFYLEGIPLLVIMIHYFSINFVVGYSFIPQIYIYEHTPTVDY